MIGSRTSPRRLRSTAYPCICICAALCICICICLAAAHRRRLVGPGYRLVCCRSANCQVIAAGYSWSWPPRVLRSDRQRRAARIRDITSKDNRIPAPFSVRSLLDSRVHFVPCAVSCRKISHIYFVPSLEINISPERQVLKNQKRKDNVKILC